MKPTSDQIAKLPKWAQDHIENLSRERDSAVDTLNKFCDNQTPSRFRVEDHPCTGETAGPSHKKSYVQGHTLYVEWAGIELRIEANDYGGRTNEIGLSWSTSMQREIALIPQSFCQVTLKTQENMK